MLIFLFQFVLGMSNIVLDLFVKKFARLFEVITDLSSDLISFYSEISPLMGEYILCYNINDDDHGHNQMHCRN